MYEAETTHKAKGRKMRRTQTTGKPKAAYRTPKKVREYQKRYYQMHKAERAAYYLENKDKIIAYQQERYQTYRKEIRAYLKDYYKKNREEILSAQKTKAKAPIKKKPVAKSVPKPMKTKEQIQRLFLYQDKTGWKLHTEPVNGSKKKLPKAAQQGPVLAIEVIA